MALHAVTQDDPRNSVECLIDEQRGIRFTYVGGLHMGRTSIFELIVPGVGSMGVQANGPSDAPLEGQPHAQWTVVSVGSAVIRFGEPNIPAVSFDSDELNARSLLIAVECLLAFGVFYDGLTLPRDHMRVDLNGQIYSIGDFGYTE